MATIKNKVLKFIYSFSILSENGNFNRSSNTNKILFPFITRIFISNFIFCILILPAVIINKFFNFSLPFYLIFFSFSYFFGYILTKKIKNDFKLHRTERSINSKIIIFLIFLLSIISIFILLIIARKFFDFKSNIN